MKKYIFGLISAICLMGAGCTQFEDYKPADLGEGPTIEAELIAPENTIGTFTVKVTPGEGTTYYSYLLTTEAIPDIDPTKLLQANYESLLTISGLEKAVLVDYSDQTSVEFTLTNQAMATTYYLYAVASNHQGVCGNIAVAELLLPDTEYPYLVDVPEDYLYRAKNNGRTVILEFNEPVVRGEGKITYSITDYDANPYKEGLIDNVVVDNETVTITLPEDAPFRENEISYVFLGFEDGAFVDASGNPLFEMIAGKDEDGGYGSPWWEYDPTNAGGGDGIELEFGENGYGEYYLMYYSLAEATDTGEGIFIAPAELITANPDSQYGVLGLGSFMYTEGAETGYCPANIVDNVFHLHYGYGVGIVTLEQQGQAVIVPMAVVVDATGNPTNWYEGETMPFYASAESNKLLESEVALAYFAADSEGNMIGYLDVMTNCTLAPASMVNVEQAMSSFNPELIKSIKANRVKAFINENVRIPYARVNPLR